MLVIVGKRLKKNLNIMSKSNYQNIPMFSGNTDDDIGWNDGTVLEQSKPQLKKPPMYKVIMLNDDYTPMDFVVEVLCDFFRLDPESATRVMLKVHTEGSAVCGVYTRDIAETKAAQVNQYAQDSEHPLWCEIEPDDEDEDEDN